MNLRALSFGVLCFSALQLSGADLPPAQAEPPAPFYIAANPKYTIVDSAPDSVRFTLTKTLQRDGEGHLVSGQEPVGQRCQTWASFRLEFTSGDGFRGAQVDEVPPGTWWIRFHNDLSQNAEADSKEPASRPATEATGEMMQLTYRRQPDPSTSESAEKLTFAFI